MPRLDTVWVVLLAMPTATFANADSIRNHREMRTDHREVAVGRDWNERDARELAEFERMAAALRDAGQDRMSGRYREVNARVQAAIAREIQQAQVKSAQAAQEARLSRREVRDERMESSMSGDTRDMFQSGDDARDRRDDMRDRDHTLARYEEMERIGTRSAALQNPIERGDRTAMKQNLEMTEKFLALMRRDLAATREEASEDRVEVREDRRERRTDTR